MQILKYKLNDFTSLECTKSHLEFKKNFSWWDPEPSQMGGWPSAAYGCFAPDTQYTTKFYKNVSVPALKIVKYCHHSTGKNEERERGREEMMKGAKKEVWVAYIKWIGQSQNHQKLPFLLMECTSLSNSLSPYNQFLLR